MSKITDREIIEMKDHTEIEEMCELCDVMIGCWGCRYFDNYFGKQISCPYETFIVEITNIE